MLCQINVALFQRSFFLTYQVTVLPTQWALIAVLHLELEWLDYSIKPNCHASAALIFLEHQQLLNHCLQLLS